MLNKPFIIQDSNETSFSTTIKISHMEIERLYFATFPDRRKSNAPSLASLQSQTHCDTSSDSITALAIERARKHVAIWDRRENYLPKQLFGDATWQILIFLLVNCADGKRVSVSAACLASGTPATTGLRHLTNLTNLGYIRRVCDPADSRRVYVELCEETKSKLIDLLGRWG
jgi:hypothetical protein